MRFENTSSSILISVFPATFVGIFAVLGLWLAADCPAAASETSAEALEKTQAMVVAAGLIAPSLRRVGRYRLPFCGIINLT
jgi:hypothetical protein